MLVPNRTFSFICTVDGWLGNEWAFMSPDALKKHISEK